ncbi:MAG: hypothetical protein GY762_17240 [Proteobacteria bacterium]|nr:hypothetical protein [Pseudomonadota bacterium]
MSKRQNELSDIKKQVSEIYADSILEMILSGHFSAMKKGTPDRDKETNTEQDRSVNEFNLGTQE